MKLRHACLPLVAAALVACSVEDGFVVAHAELADAHYLEMLDRRSDDEKGSDRDRLGVFAHRIESGEGLVFGYRRFEDQGPHVIDEETFEKVTVWLAREPSSGARVALDDAAGVLVVYSIGGSAWPRSACSGRIGNGHVVATRFGNRYRVAVVGTLEQMGNSATSRCAPVRIDREFVATPMGIDELTTWLGRAGNHAYDETYR